MIIKEYSCRQFAGLSEKNIEFKENLNVLLGPNEAGKSTLVEGIYSVLFKSSKLGNRTSDDKEFRSRFMPLALGDSIDGKIILSNEKGEYVLKKEWGEDSLSELVLPDASRIRANDAIEDVLKGVLLFGEGTYRGVVFSKQAQIKSAIDDIVRNRAATDEVGSLLRKAIMELDGISLDDLRRKIDEEIKKLTGRWDTERECPENNREISNPYLNGLGEIIKHYYDKENYKRDMKAAMNIEERMDSLFAKMEGYEKDLSLLKERKESMEKLEQDVHKRVGLEPQKGQLQEKLGELFNINREWPKNELRLEQLANEIKEIIEKQKTIDDEREKAGKLSEKQRLEKLLERVKESSKQGLEIEKKIEPMKAISDKDINELDAARRKMNTARAKMEAGTMFASAEGIKSGVSIFVTTDMEEPKEVKDGEAIKANGYIKLESEAFGSFEIKSGDIDFNELRSEFSEGKARLEALLRELDSESLEDARYKKRRREDLLKEIEGIQNQIKSLLEGENIEELSARIIAFGDLSSVRELSQIELESKALITKSIEKNTEKGIAEKSIGEWSQAYGNLDGLFNETLEVKKKMADLDEQLNNMQPLPEEYHTADEFLEKLHETRKQHEEKNLLLMNLKESYYELEREKPELTHEELKGLYEDEEREYNKSLFKAKKLLVIKEAFELTKSKMDNDSFRPVIESFSRYISALTNDAYEVSDIDERLNPVIRKNKSVLMPIELLSSGTYDSVALALRLAILGNILKNNRGFMILDDCLVDLDPLRRDKAVKLIKDFSAKHQVIFTTCNPDTAKALGGNLIEM